jgi:Xaa-Pro aminopeptidase
VKEQLNIREWRHLSELFDGVEWCDLGEYLNSLRLVKSSVELSLVRETTRILEEALTRCEKTAAPGQKEYQIMAELEREARRRGVEDFRLLLARSGTPGIGLRPAADSALQKGESILILVAASCQRYWAELGRTYCLGRPSEEIAKSYEQASRLFRQLVQGTKAGISTTAASGWLSEVASSAARDSLRAYGLGNGVGLDLSEEPYLGTSRNGVIQPGMVLTLRACFTGGDCGSALISRPYLVTESGLESLARYEEKLVTIMD